MNVADVNVDKLVIGANNTVIKVNNLVKSVTLSDDKKSATVVLYNDFVDATEYQITVKGYDMVTMTASVGAPASIVLSSSKYGIINTVVADGTSTEICARLYDANGIDVTATETGNEKLSFKITYTTGGYTYDGSTGKYLYFTTVGDSAVVEATYHSGEYDNQGNEIGKVVSAPFTFIGVDKSYVSVVGVTRYGLGGEYNGTNIKMDAKDTGLALGIKFKLADGNDSQYTLYGQEIKDQNKASLNLGTLTFKSLNTDILEVKNGTVFPYKPGTTQVMAYGLKDGKETALAAVTIEVLDWPALTTVNFSSNRVVVSADATVNVSAPTVTVYCKDQYGKSFTNADIFKVVGDSDVAKAAEGAISWSAFAWTNETISINVETLKAVKALYARDAASMAFKFNIHVRNYYNNSQVVVAPLVIELREANDTVTYDIEATGLTENNVARRVTLYDDFTTEDAKSVTFSLYKMSNFAKIDTQAIQKAPTTVSATTVTGGVFYYKLTRNGSVIDANTVNTDKGIITVDFTCITDDKQVIPSKEIGRDNNNNAIYQDRGAGVYELTIYQGIGAGSWKAVASERVTVTYDTGAYSFVGRRAVEAADASDAAILACFGFKNKEGNEMSTQTANDFFDGISRTFTLTKNANASSVNTIFVEKVTFYESLERKVYNEDGTVKEVINEGQKVAYDVWVNQAVKIAE